MKTVLELGQIVAGPTAGLIFADLGFNVIKIEKPGSGDVSRRLSGTSAGTFVYYNRGKKSVELDITSEDGKEKFKKLLEKSDIIIENMAPKTMEKLNLAYNDLKNINEKIIYISIKGYMDGPYENRKSLDYPIEIESGLAYMTGTMKRPMRMGASIVDMSAAMIGVIKALQLISENRGGFIKIGLFETAMFLVGQHISTYQATETDLPPINEKNFAWGIYDYFTTAENKKIFIAVTTDEQWRDFCKAFKLEYLLQEKFNTNEDRYKERNFLIPEIQKAIISMKYDSIIKILNDRNIVYGQLNKPWELLKDEHAMKHMVKTTFNNKEYEVPYFPSGTPGYSKVPELGSSNEDVLSGL
jgi:crotonobetainyl-CoA:carnitine CoA-transferase CaiB-like acyl-CoA transferase